MHYLACFLMCACEYYLAMLQMCGPTGMGFLWGKSEVLESMPPFLG